MLALWWLFFGHHKNARKTSRLSAQSERAHSTPTETGQRQLDRRADPSATRLNRLERGKRRERKLSHYFSSCELCRRHRNVASHLKHDKCELRWKPVSWREGKTVRDRVQPPPPHCTHHTAPQLSYKESLSCAFALALNPLVCSGHFWITLDWGSSARFAYLSYMNVLFVFSPRACIVCVHVISTSTSSIEIKRARRLAERAHNCWILQQCNEIKSLDWIWAQVALASKERDQDAPVIHTNTTGDWKTFFLFSFN